MTVGVAAAVVGLVGCEAAPITSNLRAPSGPEMSMTTRCVDFSTGGSSVNALLKQYDGWKLVYTSEYTTGNKSTTAMVMCFERPYLP
jgi:hypothetical protein